MGDLIVGIDVGTTHVKAVAYDASTQAPRGAHHIGTPWRHHGPLTDADPAHLAGAAVAVAEAAVERAGGGRVAGIGVTGMAESGALVDRHGALLGPVLAWHDPRGAEELAGLLDADEFTATTGMPWSALPSIAKAAWVRRHVDAARAAVGWRNVPELVVGALGPDAPAEWSLASRTGLLDVLTGQWWPAALAALGLPDQPPPTAAGTAAGRVTGAGRLAGAVLTVAGHDHQCAQVGAGALGEGDLFDSFGSAEAVVRAVAAPIPRPVVVEAVGHGLTVGRHVIPGRLSVLGGTRGGLALGAVRAMLGATDPDGAARLDADALTVGTPGTVRLSGVGAAAVTIGGVTADTTPGQVWFAAVKAAADALDERLAALHAVLGPPTRVVATGGWMRSATVRAVKGARLGRFEQPCIDEAGCLGAALLAGDAADVVASPVAVPTGADR